MEQRIVLITGLFIGRSIIYCERHENIIIYPASLSILLTASVMELSIISDILNGICFFVVIFLLCHKIYPYDG